VHGTRNPSFFTQMSEPARKSTVVLGETRLEPQPRLVRLADGTANHAVVNGYQPRPLAGEQLARRYPAHSVRRLKQPPHPVDRATVGKQIGCRRRAKLGQRVNTLQLFSHGPTERPFEQVKSHLLRHADAEQVHGDQVGSRDGALNTGAVTTAAERLEASPRVLSETGRPVNTEIPPKVTNSLRSVRQGQQFHQRQGYLPTFANRISAGQTSARNTLRFQRRHLGGRLLFNVLAMVAELST